MPFVWDWSCLLSTLLSHLSRGQRSLALLQAGTSLYVVHVHVHLCTGVLIPRCAKCELGKLLPALALLVSCMYTVMYTGMCTCSYGLPIVS